ncbi:hypothetical protein D3C75_410230 [compost metagenome]
MEEIKELQKGMNSILVELGKIQVVLEQFAAVPTQVAQTERNVLILEQNVLTLKGRLDTLEKEAAEKKTDKKWLIGLTLGSAALLWKIADFFVKVNQSL